jgi:hypothetical protein
MTIRLLKKKIKRLLKIERSRLPYSTKWDRVDVFIENGMIVHHWSGRKKWFKFHRIERPIDKLDYLIQYHSKKLKECK